MKKITSLFALLTITGLAFAQKPSLKISVNTQDIGKMKEAFAAGADANEKWSGAPAIYWASSRGNTDLIKLLLEKGAKVDELNMSGMTPLMGIVNAPVEPETIVKENAAANERVLKRFTQEKAKESGWWMNTDPAKFSSVANRIKALLDAGADPNFVWNKQWTPFLYTVDKGNLAFAKLMLDTKKVNLELHVSQWVEGITGTSKSLELSVYEKADHKDTKFWSKVSQYNTPLLTAIEKSNVELVKLLVNSGADINNGKKKENVKNDVKNAVKPEVKSDVKNVEKPKITEYNYYGPLDIAMEKGNKEIIEFLKSKKATQFQKSSDAPKK